MFRRKHARRVQHAPDAVLVHVGLDVGTKAEAHRVIADLDLVNGEPEASRDHAHRVVDRKLGPVASTVGHRVACVA